MSFEPAVSLTEQIADHIGTQIITGRLKPAARIQELKVAAELGVSRGSVREALLILQRRHLIEIIPRRGAIVSRLEAHESTNFCELFTDLQVSFFSKLAGVRKLDPQPFKNAIDQMAEALAQDDSGELLAGRNGAEAADTAPADGLYLAGVEYPAELGLSRGATGPTILTL